MRYFVIDEISKADMEKLNNHLKDLATKSGLDGVYWIHFPDDLLDEPQVQHRSCQPHVFGLELSGNSLKAELFVRSRNQFGCSCQQYCDDRQNTYVIDFVLNLVQDLNIRT
jgi:hypothetical protein